MTKNVVIGLLCVLAATFSITPIYSELMPPSKQIALGTGIDEIMCNVGKILVKSPSDRPACVSFGTAERLLARGGWHSSVPLSGEQKNINDSKIGESENIDSPHDGVVANNDKLLATKNPGFPGISKPQSGPVAAKESLSNLEIINRLSYKAPKDPVLSIPSVAHPPDDTVSIAGYAFSSHQPVQITVFDPSQKIIKTETILTQSDRFFSTKFFVVPSDAQHGTWTAKLQDGANTLESAFLVGIPETPKPAKKTLDGDFDGSQCQKTDDPLIIYKCWEQNNIASNIDCQGLSHAKSACRPPDSVYREAPAFSDTSYSDVIPSDIAFDYKIRMPPDDADAFAQKMASFMGDEIKEKRITKNNKTIRYENDYSWIAITPHMLTDWYGFEYTIIGAGRIPPEDGKEFTASLLDELGIALDGTEFYREGVPASSHFSHQLFQTKDGIIVASNSIATTVEQGYTKIHINNWNDNLSDVALYDLDESIKNGQGFALANEQLAGTDCQLEIREGTDDDYSLVILEGRPLYDIYGGSCQVDYADGHNGWYSVFVDAITGEPLFIKSRSTF